MEYEKLLDAAYKDIKPVGKTERFEIKKAEGHYEGGKTIVSNFLQIVSSLRRKPEHLAKFLFKELAAPGEIKGDRLRLTRKIPSKIINEKINKYAKEFVICSSCKKPDTELFEDKGEVFMRCMACGNKKRVFSGI